ncbi:pilin, putative [Psychromonas ingrahamii 37]|uniref:Type II secretion system protein H n=1 Tax=Psychromonas ingrahamii (strain DSM 17664 / CCUG 51855 / 37) TaxID=357804 RepID=A1SZM6_PSYIN|nr:GspH/FimT family protein [Psychromonas ingrahamii]ABM04941.1 pilin, putative [Psychromonas ingrahamii 37]
MKFSSTKNSQGMTLLELLITLAIIIILSSIAVPSYRTFMANERFAIASNELYNAYRFARNEAIKTSSSMTLKPKTGGWVNGWQVTDSSGTVLLVSKKPHDSITVTGVAVTVKGMGALSGGGVTFLVEGLDGKSSCLSVLSSGQSQLTDEACP